MKNHFAALVLAGLSIFSPGHASAGLPENQSSSREEVPEAVSDVTPGCTRLDFHVIPFVYKENFSTSVNALGDTLVSGKAHNAPGTGFGLGLVRAERDVTVTARVGTDGCRVFGVHLGFVNNHLFVGRELRAKACVFEHILNHELEHVALYRRFLAEKVPA